MKTFNYHVVLDAANICNYENEKATLTQQVARGQRIVIYGRRNTGKTSLVQSVLIPFFKKKHTKGLVVYVDFMGVRDLEQIADRIRVAFQKGFSQSFPKRNVFNSVLDLIKALRPTVTLDPITNEMALSLTPSPGKSVVPFEDILKEIDRIHKKFNALLIFDEFQDIHTIAEAEGKLRGCLQTLSSDLPIVILGSKKHLLAHQFAAPNAPFAGWGIPLEIPKIKPEDYRKYINERFSVRSLKIGLEETKFLMDLMQGVPECINLVCYTILSSEEFRGDLTKEAILLAVRRTVEKFHSNYTEILTTFTAAEENVLVLLAKEQPVRSPQNSQFLKKINYSTSAVQKIIKRFEDQALICRLEEGLVLADPLMAQFIREFI